VQVPLPSSPADKADGRMLKMLDLWETVLLFGEADMAASLVDGKPKPKALGGEAQGKVLERIGLA
jgi:hypothetical protein